MAPNQPDWGKIMDRTDPVASAEEIVRSAEEWGTFIANYGLEKTQIRGAFGQVRLIELSWPRGEKNSPNAQAQLKLLKPKLAYQAKRIDKFQPLADLLKEGISKVSDRETFQRFVDFFEAVVAYHRSTAK